MPNMLDALYIMGDKSMAELPWTDMDSMLVAAVCYNHLGHEAAGAAGVTLREAVHHLERGAWDNLPNGDERLRLIQLMAETRRWGGSRVCCYVDILDNSKPIQFSAMTFQTEGGPIAIGYRGTDSTLAGWREDLYMSFDKIVPGQIAAASYLTEVAERTEGSIVLAGHSKGGNLAFYAAATADASIRDRIAGAWSFDGPGLDEEVLETESYKAIGQRLHAIQPQGSVVGLMKGHRDDCRIVHSTASGFHQHDIFTWETAGMDFVPEKEFTFGSRVMDKTLEGFLSGCSPDDRKIVVKAVFDYLDATGSSTVQEIKSGKIAALQRAAASGAKLSPEARTAFIKITGTLIASGFGSAAETAQQSIADNRGVEKMMEMLHRLTENAGELKERIRPSKHDEKAMIADPEEKKQDDTHE